MGWRGWITRAALLKTARRAVFALSLATAPQLFSSTRCVRRKIVQNKKFNALSYVELFLVGAGGFEPPKLKAADLQSVPIGHSGTRPYSFVSDARTACIYYHAQSSLSTICNRFYRNFCTNLSNKLAPWKNRPEINVPERFFLELVTGVERATGIASLKNGDFYTKICTFSSLFLVPSCTANTPTKSKVC